MKVPPKRFRRRNLSTFVALWLMLNDKRNIKSFSMLEKLTAELNLVEFYTS